MSVLDLIALHMKLRQGVHCTYTRIKFKAFVVACVLGRVCVWKGAGRAERMVL